MLKEAKRGQDLIMTRTSTAGTDIDDALIRPGQVLKLGFRCQVKKAYVIQTSHYD
jgi:hypothetical protein